MKRTIIFSPHLLCALLVAVIGCYLYPGISFADPPQYVYMEYDAFFERLSVTITHASAATEKHYIKTVIIKKNGDTLSTNSYDSQPDPQTFTYIYEVSAEDGDGLEVTTVCSTYGSKTDTFYVKKY